MRLFLYILVTVLSILLLHIYTKKDTTSLPTSNLDPRLIRLYGDLYESKRDQKKIVPNNKEVIVDPSSSLEYYKRQDYIKEIDGNLFIIGVLHYTGNEGTLKGYNIIVNSNTGQFYSVFIPATELMQLAADTNFKGIELGHNLH